MTKDVVSVYNLALSIVGTRARISVITENSREAEVCNLWYEISRDIVLRAAYWPSTVAHQRLGVLKERANLTDDWTVDDPAPDWLFAYGLPSDMIAPRYLTTFGRFSIEWWTPNTQAHTKALMANQPEAILQYSFLQAAPQQWDDGLYLAVAYALAMNIAMPLTGKLTRQRQAQDAGNRIIAQARANVANASEDVLDVVPEWISARGYDGQAPLTKFYWPFGSALAASTQTITSTAVGTLSDAVN